MGKLIILFLALLLLPSVLAFNVAYIVKTPSPLNSDEIAIKNLLTEDGYSVTVLDDVPFNADLYDIIIVGEDVSNVNSIFDDKEHKTLFLSDVAAKYAGLSRYNGETSGTKITISDNEHSITEGLSLGDLTVYLSSESINYLYGCRALNSESLAYKTYTYRSVLLTLKEDSLLLDSSGSCSKRNVPIYERNVFFGLSSASYWNSNTKALFLRSIDWLLYGEDNDGDGYYYDEDCDDNNADIWKNIEGYVDSDEDGYGTGSLIDVCSGDYLAEEHSYIDGDCNDGNFSINPEAEEIPYNNIDEDCSGEDLTDVDDDGYNAVIVGGDDCDDLDETINPGSEDVYKNCRNDAPIVEEIEKISIYETGDVIIEVEAVDPEDDDLFYSINNSRFSQDENIFTWETDYEDYGDYAFTITVSDGNLESEIEVEVEVKNKNQAPTCDEIPDLEWNEDEKTSLNLNTYCSDLDNDTLDFYVFNTSSDTYVSLGSLENGIANFSSAYNWNGEDWIIFKVSDGKDYILTNEIILRVLPVNDEPVFFRNIQNITWNEDTNLTNYLNLKNYFSDVDSELSFSVAGNTFIDIIINNGLVSFYPQKDWFGTENVVFSASDGEYNVDSNEVTLSVLDMNEPPEFVEMNCTKEISEDTSYICELNASDFENDELSFSVVNENNLNCDVDGSVLEYFSRKDYNGQASCKIRVSDDYGYDEYLLEVNILPVNDAPVINDYSPKNNPRIMENTDQLFSISAFDVDGDILKIKWFLDDVEVGDGTSYTLNKEKGNYNVRVEVTDNIISEPITKTWAVFVGDISDFTCQEVGGDICSEKELCRAENLLGVKDTTNCCSIPCSPSFSKTERCKNLSGSVEVEIEKPDEDEEFMAGDIIDVKVDVSNREENDHKFKVNAYLYDLTKDRKVEDDDDSVRIDKEDTETVKFEFKVEEDIDEDKNYAIFVSAIDQDGEFCNEDYVEINIEREEEVVIKEFNMPEIVKCENSFDIEAKVKNMGRDDEENVYVVIENQELGIHEKSEEFKLEEYEEDDEAVKYFTIKNPQNISGSHIIKASVFFNGESNSQEKEIVFEECKKIEVTKEEIGKIFLEGKTEGKEVKEQNNKKLIILLLISMFFVLIAITFLFYLIFKARKSI